MVKPILKWVGGKTQILDKLISEFPVEINNYYEIFLGGGSVLLALLSCKKKKTIQINGTISAYDINEVLIHVYKNIQSSPNELFEEIQIWIEQYVNCPQNGIVNRKPINIDEAITSTNPTNILFYFLILYYFISFHFFSFKNDRVFDFFQ